MGKEQFTARNGIWNWFQNISWHATLSWSYQKRLGGQTFLSTVSQWLKGGKLLQHMKGLRRWIWFNQSVSFVSSTTESLQSNHANDNLRTKAHLRRLGRSPCLFVYKNIRFVPMRNKAWRTKGCDTLTLGILSMKALWHFDIRHTGPIRPGKAWWGLVSLSKASKCVLSNNLVILPLQVPS